ncbi:hypothetical protein M0R72_02445 [Candidatus Pacearchaeota archaeon]|jgi:hypothetical protein|nr:hypothetical protein [Candidatus Pacearchaeota archaeon]
MKKFITLSFLLSALLLSCTTNKTNPIPQVDVGAAGAVGIGGGFSAAGTCDVSESDAGAGGIAGVGGK